MDVYSDSIGLQFYTGNNLSKIKGKIMLFTINTAAFVLNHNIFLIVLTQITLKTYF